MYTVSKVGFFVILPPIECLLAEKVNLNLTSMKMLYKTHLRSV